MIVLRILLYILLGIAALLGVILSMRLKIYIRMTDTFGLRAGLGPVVLTLAPAKPKKPVGAIGSFGIGGSKSASIF